MAFQCINIRQVPWEVLKTLASGLGFQHLPWNLANVNAWKTIFDPYSILLAEGTFSEVTPHIVRNDVFLSHETLRKQQVGNHPYFFIDIDTLLT